MRLLAATLAASWLGLGAPADPLQPDPPPVAHHRAHVVWTYVLVWHLKDGTKVRCVVPPTGTIHCRRIR